MTADAAMRARAAAAIRLVSLGELSPSTALFLTAFPPDDVAHASASRDLHTWSDEHRARAVELVDGGASWAEAARAIGASKASVGTWLRAARAA